MTVGIGAVCQNGTAVIVAADRMMTYGTPLNLQVEMEVKKLWKCPRKPLYFIPDRFLMLRMLYNVQDKPLLALTFLSCILPNMSKWPTRI